MVVVVGEEEEGGIGNTLATPDRFELARRREVGGALVIQRERRPTG